MQVREAIFHIDSCEQIVDVDVNVVVNVDVYVIVYVYVIVHDLSPNSAAANKTRLHFAQPTHPIAIQLSTYG